MNMQYRFIDWLKVTAMILILFGHLFGDQYTEWTQPIYPKQLGVSFFIFILGWGLASEHRPKIQVIYKRLFNLFLWGISVALIISSLSYYHTGSALALSNYLPFLGGLNLAFNNFPANPTTWFIGTYIHIVLLWAIILHRVNVTPTLLLFSLVIEIVARANWLQADLQYTAYMSFTNWMTMFFLGIYMSKQKDESSHKNVWWWVIAWLSFMCIWYWLTSSLDFDDNFPFRLSPVSGVLGVSLMSSFMYLSHTWMAIQVFSRLPSFALLRFLSKHTILVFIVHMPLILWSAPKIAEYIPNGWQRRLLMLALIYCLFAYLEKLLTDWLKLQQLRDRIWNIVLANLPTLFKSKPGSP